jgi:hypothetical protein
MRLLLIIVGAFAAIVWIQKPAEARDYPWCAFYDDKDGGFSNCGFVTIEQCRAAVSGVGGSCGVNRATAQYSPQSAAPGFDLLPKSQHELAPQGIL